MRNLRGDSALSCLFVILAQRVPLECQYGIRAPSAILVCSNLEAQLGTNAIGNRSLAPI